MFEKLQYKKLKNSYDFIISCISEDDIDGLKINIDNAYSAAQTLLNKINKSSKKHKLVLEELQEVKRMLTNLESISAYYYGYLSYYYFEQFDNEFKNENYEEAIETCYNARFRKNEMYGFKITPLNEPELIYTKDNKTYYCQGMSRIIKYYNKTRETNIEKISLDRHKKVKNILDEISERERIEQERIDAENYRLAQIRRAEENEHNRKKITENYEYYMQRGSDFSYVNPNHSLDCYINAYRTVEDEEGFEEEQETARKKVVDAYVSYIKDRSSFFHGTSSNQHIMQQCKKGLDLCENAYEWTTSADRHKIEQIESDLKYEYNKAHTNYYIHDEY